MLMVMALAMAVPWTQIPLVLSIIFQHLGLDSMLSSISTRSVSNILVAGRSLSQIHAGEVLADSEARSGDSDGGHDKAGNNDVKKVFATAV